MSERVKHCTLIEHPLAADRLAMLRDAKTDVEQFRRALGQLSAVEALWLAVSSLLVGLVLGVAASSSLGQSLGLLAVAVAAAVFLTVVAKRWIRPRVYS